MYYVFSAGTILLGILFIRTIMLRKTYTGTGSHPDSEFMIPDGAVERLAEAVRFKTVTSYRYDLIDLEEHSKFEIFLKQKYPSVTGNLEQTKLNDFALIYKWKGTDETLDPVLLMAHFDVVPAQAEGWKHGAFEGIIEEGRIWGRGTLDTKNSLIAIMEAAEILTAEGFRPERTVYFSFGGDEEIMGMKGAVIAVEYFRKQGIKFDWLLDEGAIVAENMVKLTDRPLALIGVAEKGFGNILLSAEGSGGHSSMPPDHTASGRVARAVSRIESRQFPSGMSPTVRGFLKALIPWTDFGTSLILSNLWLFGGLVRRIFIKSPATAAMVRTTVAATMMSGSEKDNILPDRAEAVINVRIQPGTTKEAVLDRIRDTIGDRKVTVSYMNSDFVSNPVSESSITSDGFKKIESAAGKAYPDAVPAPFLVTVSTDSRHFRNLAKDIYRFSPMKLTPEELATVHGVNESISIDGFGRMIQFFYGLMKEL